MSDHRNRLSLLCSQLLALATVATMTAALLGPTAGPAAEPGTEDGSSDPDEATGTSLVAATPVEPTLRRVPLAAAASGRAGAGVGLRVLSGPEPVAGHGTVGVTWRDDQPPAEEELLVEVRTATDGRWSAWQEMEYHPEHGPDPSTPEGRAATLRGGTEPVVVGDVDHVQVRATTSDGPLEGLELDIIDPGVGAATTAAPAYRSDRGATAPTSAGAVALAAGTPPRPSIFRRWQWGADERLREKGSVSYGRVRMGVVHHTVNANGYSRSQVPQIIRGIYAYHTKARGWSDIGYNFLVDRFGRIWEGRWGGIEKAVVGAHTYGYNTRSFALSAIGNFETTRPSNALVMAYGTLMGWKLARHGVNATKKWVWVKPHQYFRPVSGHRDAGATACPGRYLHARLPDIRQRAAWLQKRNR